MSEKQQDNNTKSQKQDKIAVELKSMLLFKHMNRSISTNVTGATCRELVTSYIAKLDLLVSNLPNLLQTRILFSTCFMVNSQYSSRQYIFCWLI